MAGMTGMTGVPSPDHGEDEQPGPGRTRAQVDDEPGSGRRKAGAGQDPTRPGRGPGGHEVRK